MSVCSLRSARAAWPRALALLAALATVLVAPQPPAGAAYPGENGLLVFVQVNCSGGVDDYTCTTAVRTSTATGEEQKTLVADTDAYDTHPSWSPDGRRIVYIGRNEHIWVMAADGTGKRRVTERSSGSQKRRPVFTPDGRRIMYGDFGRTGRRLFTIKLDGTGKRRILDDLPGEVSLATFSPTGNRIAFEYWRHASDDPYASGIYTARLDGTGLRRVTAPTRRDREPDWSPDGRWILFQRQVDRDINLYRIHPDGTGLDRLTNLSDANATDGAWSPDGNRIAFVAESADDDIWIMNADGSDKRPILNDPETVAQLPHWQPR